MVNRRFGLAWLAFALAVALHVLDEATHDFLSFYNPSVKAIGARLPFIPLPTFTFRVWLLGLIAFILVLLGLSPLAFRRLRWMRIMAIPIAVIVGIFNASLHIVSSIYYRRWMAGVYSAPVLVIAAVLLLVSSASPGTGHRPQGLTKS